MFWDDARDGTCLYEGKVASNGGALMPWACLGRLRNSGLEGFPFLKD